MQAETWQALRALIKTDPPDVAQWGRLLAMQPDAETLTKARMAAARMVPQHEVAELLGVKVRTIQNWRRKGLLKPAACPTHSTVLFRLADVEAFLAQGTREAVA